MTGVTRTELKGMKLTPVPNVTRIVYSTCSIHKTEDESVVSRLLAYSRQHPSQFNGESYVWVLEERDNLLPTWQRRGLPDPLSPKDAEKVIRCAPEDHTNGFFVACFKRIPLSELDTEPDGAEPVEPEVPAAKPAETKKAAAKAAVKAAAKGESKGESKNEGKNEGKGKKRPAEEEAEEGGEEETREDAKPKKQKTAAQLERAKRKKKAQKAKAGR